MMIRQKHPKSPNKGNGGFVVKRSDLQERSRPSKSRGLYISSPLFPRRAVQLILSITTTPSVLLFPHSVTLQFSLKLNRISDTGLLFPPFFFFFFFFFFFIKTKKKKYKKKKI